MTTTTPFNDPKTANINTLSISGVVNWLRYDPDQSTAVFTIKTARGAFYIEARGIPAPEWGVGAWVLVNGAIYSIFRKGLERTRIEAQTITLLAKTWQRG